MNIIEKNRPHYPALDGLRGAAILFVVLYHNFSSFDYFFFGWLGVDLFFVLSGYLITDILLNTAGSANYLRNFFLRRILRILPLYYLILIIFFLILPGLNFYQGEFDFYLNHQPWFWFYLQNWLLAFHFSLKGGYLAHLWSLGVEEQFYIIWPFVVLWLRKPKLLLVFMLSLLLLIVITRGIIWFQNIEGLNYTNFYKFTRVDGICVGCIIAILNHMDISYLKRRMPVIILTLAAINFLFYFFNEPYGILPYLALVGYTTFAILFGFLVYELVYGRNRLFNFIFSIRPLRFLGKISYGFYVFHLPIYIMLFQKTRQFIHDDLNIAGLGLNLLSSSLVTLISFTISVISYYTYERMWLKLKKRFT
ncbi:MAG TPA: acyltransferase [Chitinophagaceae bacterium]|nr:acyltransferase [Chitinophagaceae bacterium]